MYVGPLVCLSLIYHRTASSGLPTSFIFCPPPPFSRSIAPSPPCSLAPLLSSSSLPPFFSLHFLLPPSFPLAPVAFSIPCSPRSPRSQITHSPTSTPPSPQCKLSPPHPLAWPAVNATGRRRATTAPTHSSSKAWRSGEAGGRGVTSGSRGTRGGAARCRRSGRGRGVGGDTRQTSRGAAR
jgi:hypothetical protein